MKDFDDLWDYSDPKATEEKFKKLLNSSDAENADYRLQLLTQIARTQGLQRKFEDGHQTLNEVEKQLSDDIPLCRVRYFLERGRMYNSSGEKEKATIEFEEALSIAKKAQIDFYSVDAAHMLGIVHKPEEQLKWTGYAIELAEQSSDERTKKWLGALYNNIGWSYFDLKQYTQALEIFQRAVKWREAHGQEKATFIAKYCVAKTLRFLGRFDEALAIQLALKEETEQKNWEPDGYVIEEIGECYLALNKINESEVFLVLAKELLSKEKF